MRLPLFSTHTTHHCCSPSIHFQLPFFPSLSAAHRKSRWLPRMDATIYHRHHRRKDKVIVIMGATGTGKSRLSVDLATRYPFSEIINSDKMQVYRGLDITTNKIPVDERNNVPHHLLGEVDPVHGELSPSEFRCRAGSVIADICSRRKLPIIVGGSNSFIHALLVEKFDPESNVFDDSSLKSIAAELRYNCCFLWVDVSVTVLPEYLSKRVDDMLDSGIVGELARFFDPESHDLEDDSAHRVGLRKAIGVPEFDRYFQKYPPPLRSRDGEVEDDDDEDDRARKDAYEEAVKAIKDNTCQLAKRQVGKILRLKRTGWDLQRLDATEAFRAVLTRGYAAGDGGERWSDIWEGQVLEPSVKIVRRFLKEEQRKKNGSEQQRNDESWVLDFH